MYIELVQFPENDSLDEPTFDPELIDPLFAKICKPRFRFMKESHQIIFHHGIGYII
jgi:hypothetical protein